MTGTSSRRGSPAVPCDGFHHGGRYGIEQLTDDGWVSCTVWGGYDKDDALEEVARGNAIRGSVSFRAFDRLTGTPLGAESEAA